MLTKAGHLDGLNGVVVGQFTAVKPQASWTVVDVLHDHLMRLDVPVLGGLPIGYGVGPRAVPLGTTARLDATGGTLQVSAGVTEPI